MRIFYRFFQAVSFKQYNGDSNLLSWPCSSSVSLSVGGLIAWYLAHLVATLYLNRSLSVLKENKLLGHITAIVRASSWRLRNLHAVPPSGTDLKQCHTHGEQDMYCTRSQDYNFFSRHQSSWAYTLLSLPIWQIHYRQHLQWTSNSSFDISSSKWNPDNLYPSLIKFGGTLYC